MFPISRGALAALALGLFLLPSCTGDSDRPQEEPEVPGTTTPSALTPEAQALIDSANALVRADLHQEALELYRRAVAAAPGNATPWFGIGLAAEALGDSALADSARVMTGGGMPGHGGDHPPMPPGG